MDANQYRRILKEGDRSFDKDFGGIIGMRDELERIKKISNPEIRCKEAFQIWSIHNV